MSLQVRTTHLHRGFLVLYYAVGPSPAPPPVPWPGPSPPASFRFCVPQGGNYLWRNPRPASCPPQDASVLLAQWLPQKLTSPGYPEPYVKGQVSTTHIEAPEGFVVRLIFQDFDLELSQDCEQDSVTITASGIAPNRFCGHQSSQLDSTPSQREFVSSGRRLQLTFRTGASLENRTTCLHRGFLALYQAVAVKDSQPTSQASEGPEAISTPVDNSSKIQSHCQKPYYQAVPPGTTEDTRKGSQNKEEAPQCVPVCGQPVSPITENQEALGSSRAQLGNFPWQVFTNIYGRGGGALLGDRWVLTAAHTIHPKDIIFSGKNPSVDVFLGHTNIEEIIKLGNYPVRHVFVHPDYHQNDSHNFDGDIALLELQHSVPLSPHILPVCLPHNETLYLSGLWGYVSGFGIENDRLTGELKYTRLPIAKREACEAWLRKKQRPEVFSDNMFCVETKTQQTSVCYGDSGSVYVVWDDRANHWVATGIVSWGIGCGSGYDFYTKVFNYMDWIKRVMEGKD